MLLAKAAVTKETIAAGKIIMSPRNRRKLLNAIAAALFLFGVVLAARPAHKSFELADAGVLMMIISYAILALRLILIEDE